MKPKITKHTDELEFLKSQGFAINTLNKYANSLSDVWKLSRNLEKERTKLQFGIDGMVVKINNLQLSDSAGIVGKTPRAHCAIKFPAEEATTKLHSLVWQVGRTGKVTPVAEFEPTQVAGTVVRRATLHNYKEFTESGLRQNDTLVIRKAGDIIPEVVTILTNLREEQSHTFKSPTNCPECTNKLILSKSKVDLQCPNISSCPAQVIGRLSYFAQRSVANIAGLSEKQIQKFVELYKIKDIYELYDLPFEKIHDLDGFGEKSVSNLKASIEKASVIPDKRFLTGLSIEGVGNEVSSLILSKLNEKLNEKQDSTS